MNQQLQAAPQTHGLGAHSLLAQNSMDTRQSPMGNQHSIINFNPGNNMQTNNQISMVGTPSNQVAPNLSGLFNTSGPFNNSFNNNSIGNPQNMLSYDFNLNS